MIIDDEFEVRAVKIKDVLIYKKNVSKEELNEFDSNIDLKYLEEPKPSLDSIIISNSDISKIHLMEWKKYKVLSKSNKVQFEEDDFIKIGEFGTAKYGTLVFKNCIGIAFFKNISLIIDSSKITSSDMNKMSETVNGIISNLSYDFNQPTYSRITRNPRKTSDLNYHIYLLIINMLSTESNAVNLFVNFKLINNNPHRQMISQIEYENINMVSSLSEDSIIDIFSGNCLLIPCNDIQNKLGIRLSNGINNYLPKEVLLEEIVDSYDNNENRFIKYFIQLCLSIIERFQEKFKKQKKLLNTKLITNNEKYIGELKSILNNSFLKNVGDMKNIPMYSTVLTKRDGYRQFFKMYLGLKSIPINVFDENELEELIENKSLDVLYENFCFFTVAQLLSELYGGKLDKKKYKVDKTEFSKTLKKKTNSNYFVFTTNGNLPTVRLHYNKNYGKTASYSKSYDPDISLEILDIYDQIQAIYLFDAKFKVLIYGITPIEDIENQIDNTGNIRTFNFDDISKMHTYKDAIKLSRGAYILYPGDQRKVYYEDDMIPKIEYQGVGAFGLRPGVLKDLFEIKKVFQQILTTYKIIPNP